MADLAAAFRMWMEREPTGALLVAAALLLALLAAFKKRKPWTAYLQGRAILTANEKEFFYRLTRALPAYHVFPQVSFSALVAVDKRLSPKQQFAIRRRFGFKYADFVICERKTLDVLAVVELDDRTHNAESDRKRDVMLSAAGYRILRFHSKSKPTEAEIAALVADLHSHP